MLALSDIVLLTKPMVLGPIMRIPYEAAFCFSFSSRAAPSGPTSLKPAVMTHKAFTFFRPALVDDRQRHRRRNDDDRQVHIDGYVADTGIAFYPVDVRHRRIHGIHFTLIGVTDDIMKNLIAPLRGSRDTPITAMLRGLSREFNELSVTGPP